MTLDCHINDGIRNAEKNLVALRALKERFPDARFIWNRWTADVWKIATHVEIEAYADERGPYVRLWCYVEVEGLRIYDSRGTRDVLATLDWLREKQPTAYARLVDATARSAITPPEDPR